ncbi:MAG: RnfABCDGE type electron transport complex subunit D [Kiritimatiellae bacterium]|nr:RnfABCDGE type electron transport complex subunit D [Kiritimatiellia bacterium]
MNTAVPQTKIVAGTSPHLHAGSSVSRIMLDVLLALAPAMAAAVWFFGWNAVRLVAICVVSCLAAEWLCRRAMKRDNTLGDFSAAVTGLLLAFNLPPALPGWMAAAGSFFAIAVAKQVFGGIGYNPFNPALIGRVFLLISFTGPMTTWTASIIDATTCATPLGMVKEALKAGEALPFAMNPARTWDFFVGNMNGCLGETSALALLLGAGYLLWRRVISWHTPVAYLATVAAYAAILRAVNPAAAMPVHFHLLTGGLVLGACFMATDMVTTPVTRSGRLIFGVGCGLLTMLIRTVKSGAYPEGVSFAILIMNAFTPLINRATRPKVFGQK